MTNKMLDLLYRSFDGSITAKERQELEEALKADKLLRAEQDKIIRLRKALSGQSVPSFRPFFADRVVNEIVSLNRRRQRESSFMDSLVFNFRRLALAGVFTLVLMLCCNLFKSDRLTLTSALGWPQVTIEEIFVPSYPTSLQEIE